MISAVALQMWCVAGLLGIAILAITLSRSKMSTSVVYSATLAICVAASLGAIYWLVGGKANASEMTPIARDAEVHTLTREVLEQHIGPVFGALVPMLAAPFGARGARRRRLETTLALFLNFDTWRGLRGPDAVEIAVRAIGAQ